MQLSTLVFASVAAFASGRLHAQRAVSIGNSTTRLDINQKVYIENAPVLGDGAGPGTVGVCTNFAPAHVANADAPKVKVCGTGIKATIYLRGDPPAHWDGTGCREYYNHQWTVGKCDTGMPPDTCDQLSPADDASIGAAQSYIIEVC